MKPKFNCQYIQIYVRCLFVKVCLLHGDWLCSIIISDGSLQIVRLWTILKPVYRHDNHDLRFENMKWLMTIIASNDTYYCLTHISLELCWFVVWMCQSQCWLLMWHAAAHTEEKQQNWTWFGHFGFGVAKYNIITISFDSASHSNFDAILKKNAWHFAWQIRAPNKQQ